MAEDIYARIRAAAFELLAEGVWPTVVEVRTRLGSGSNTTINNTLKLWRQEFLAKMATSARRPDLPVALSEAFEVIWQQACDHAEKTLEGLRIEILAERQQLHQALLASQQDVEALNTQLKNQHQTLVLSESRHTELQSLLQRKNELVTELQERQKMLETNLANAQKDIKAGMILMAEKLQEAEEGAKKQLQEVRAEAEKREALAYERLEGLRIRLYEQVEEERHLMQLEKNKFEEEAKQARHESIRLEALWRERISEREREIGRIGAKFEGVAERCSALELALSSEREQGRALSDRLMHISAELAEARGAFSTQEEHMAARLAILISTHGAELDQLDERERYTWLRNGLIAPSIK